MCVPQIKNKLQEFKHALPYLISIKNNGCHDALNHSVDDRHNCFDWNIICMPNFDVLYLPNVTNWELGPKKIVELWNVQFKSK